MIPSRFDLPADITTKLEKIERIEPTDAELSEVFRLCEFRLFECDWSAYVGVNMFGTEEA